MPRFEALTFDVVVTVSTLAFVGDIARSARQMSCLLQPDGIAIAVVPGQDPLLDLGLWLATGESAQRDIGDRRSRVMPTLLRETRLDRRLARPLAMPEVPTLHTALRLMKLSVRDSRR